MVFSLHLTSHGQFLCHITHRSATRLNNTNNRPCQSPTSPGPSLPRNKTDIVSLNRHSHQPIQKAEKEINRVLMSVVLSFTARKKDHTATRDIKLPLGMPETHTKALTSKCACLGVEILTDMTLLRSSTRLESSTRGGHPCTSYPSSRQNSSQRERQIKSFSVKKKSSWPPPGTNSCTLPPFP